MKPKAGEHTHAADSGQRGELGIDDGFRAWYAACPCCLTDAHPDIKHRLDEERILAEAAKAAER
ncbi:hypothetical protein EPN29_11065 [bacterium]|nr:MAG: hypothetical protein EPN29_11065 [bacterium]